MESTAAGTSGSVLYHFETPRISIAGVGAASAGACRARGESEVVDRGVLLRMAFEWQRNVRTD
jgi:hypothetical protein